MNATPSSRVAKLDGILARYDEPGFESAVTRDFDLLEGVEIADSQRSVHLFRATSAPAGPD